ncbi:MAG: riboflavin synthase [Bacteroidales bacterium]|nr:riboflavin synthase [Bacteroidales bacterium]
MFTGIIEEVGHVKALHRGAKSFTLEVEANLVVQDSKVGDSIATNGVCLTVTSLGDHDFSADVMPETVERTALGRLKPGSPVNLERALSLQSRLGGHIVSGHIDGTGRIAALRQDDTALWLTVECDRQLLRYIIEKGSITVEGVSLTVARVDERSFSVSLIPHTQLVTTLHSLRIGDLVNLENDIIAKYVEKLLGKTPDNTLLAKLRDNGFL